MSFKSRQSFIYHTSQRQGKCCKCEMPIAIHIIPIVFLQRKALLSFHNLHRPDKYRMLMLDAKINVRLRMKMCR